MRDNYRALPNHLTYLSAGIIDSPVQLTVNYYSTSDTGLNILPKTAWYTSYSDRVTTEMNRAFLKQLHQLWMKFGLPEDISNLDFTTIPYWGDDSHLENNWSGKRGKTLGSMLAVLAHDPDSGLILKSVIKPLP